LGRRCKWKESDVALLKRIYATHGTEFILEAFNHKFSWKAIRIQASIMGLQRIGRGGSKGQSKYDKLAYCSGACAGKKSKVSPWKDKARINNFKCPDCGGPVRYPGELSYRRKRHG